MSHSDIEIKEGAFIIADAHYAPLQREELFFLFEEIVSNKLHPTQIIFMGDIFDTLFGSIKQTQLQNQKFIALVNKVASKIEIIYLEGNHDFNLQNIFPFVKVFPLQKQPITAFYQEKKILLSHGDFDGGIFYKMYSYMIRNSVVLSILSWINDTFSSFILKKIDSYLAGKNRCKKLENFKDIIDKRMQDGYDCDYFIDGHFHQNKQYQYKTFIYINIGAFACNQRYFIVKSSDSKELLEEKTFSKGMKYG
ncbi:FIG022708: hypothetical protein [hydrothermal vent metagenome]|uniref:Calcineurin-like phosphoesterase domain-containing protein n=1 Tax=hydrothermal vent metagenome TaxID=652676 RepID=A0A1W1D4Q1_9ZZZZ